MYRDIFKEEHQILRESLKKFVENEIVPYLNKWEEEEEIPKGLYKKMGAMGYLGIRYLTEYGGSEGDIFMTLVLAEEVARCHSCGVAVSVVAHTDIASPHLAMEGNRNQKERYIPATIKGEKLCAIFVTETDAGSDVAGIKTIARKDGDSYILKAGSLCNLCF